MILSAKALLDENPNPTDDEIKRAIAEIYAGARDILRYLSQ